MKSELTKVMFSRIVGSTMTTLALLTIIVVSIFSFFPTYAATSDDLILQIPVPSHKDPATYTSTIKLCEDSDGALVCNGMVNYFAGLYNWLVVAVAIIAVVALMIGGLQWMTSRGSSGETQKAMKIISNALIGLVLTLGSYSILYLINPKLTSWPSLQISQVTEEQKVIISGLQSIQQYGEEAGINIGNIDPSSLPTTSDGNLEKLDKYVAAKEYWDITNPKGACLEWAYKALNHIYGVQKISTLPWGTITTMYPSAVAADYNNKGRFVSGLNGIHNGDLVFMQTQGTKMSLTDQSYFPPYKMSHIGIFYKRKVYHSFGLRNNILATPISSAGLQGIPQETILGYGKTNLAP